MSIKNVDDLLNFGIGRDVYNKQREAKRRMGKGEPDPMAFPKKKKQKKDVEPVIEPIIPDSSKEKLKDVAKVVNIENVMFYEGGKELKPEDAFKGMGYATFVAALFHLYHGPIGYESADLNRFTTVIQEAIRLYGPDVKLNDNVIAAASFHIDVREVSPYHALKDARASIKDNVPRSIYSDLIMSGDAGFTVDTNTGTVIIADDKGLSKKATKSMATLFQAKQSPKEEIATVVCELTKTNLQFVDELTDEVERWIETGDVPEINETNPFNSLSSVPGLLSDTPVAPGNHGMYQGVYKLMKLVEKDKPDIMFIPDCNQAVAGSWDSLGDVSRCIPLPTDLMHASMSLASINVVDFDDVIAGLRHAEITVSEDDTLKRDKDVNARSYYHEQFREDYELYVNIPHGVTRRKLRYVTLYNAKAVTAQELYNDYIDGRLDHNPVLMRASEYHLSCMKGVKGSFMITDLVAMVGVYLSPRYIAQYINPKFVTDTGKMKSATGFYSLRDFKTGAVNVYSSWIQKYTLAKMLDVLHPDKEYGKKILGIYLSYTSSKRGKKKQDTDTVATTIKNLVACYAKVKVDPEMIVVLTPNYSMRKALKYTRIMLDNELLDRMARDVQEPGGNDNADAGDYPDDEPPEQPLVEGADSDYEEYSSGIEYDLEDANQYGEVVEIQEESPPAQTNPVS